MEEGKKDIIDPWIGGQIILISEIQDKLTKVLEDAEGVDLMLDIVTILKEIKPIKRDDDE